MWYKACTSPTSSGQGSLHPTPTEALDIAVTQAARQPPPQLPPAGLQLHLPGTTTEHLHMYVHPQNSLSPGSGRDEKIKGKWGKEGLKRWLRGSEHLYCSSKDLSSIPSTHVRWIITACNSSSRASYTSSFCGHSYS